MFKLGFLAVLLGLSLGSTAIAATPRPLENSVNTLESALQCSSGFGPNSGKAVLLVPGATQTPASEYSWSYIPGLDKLGIPWCTVTLPFSNTGELQNSSEYITYAIRKMHSVTKTKIAIIGFSQGGVMPRWSLKYFPDTRDMVEDMIGIAAANHGLIELTLLCKVPFGLGCPTSFSQIQTGAKWLDALNRGGETFSGIDYTQIYTKTDDVAVPNFDESGVSSLRTGTGARANIATQDICPTNTADHFTAGSFDPVVFAIAMDAFRNPGPAKISRIKPVTPISGVCTQTTYPGVDMTLMPVNFGSKMMFTFFNTMAFQPKTTKEPELKCYATGGC